MDKDTLSPQDIVARGEAIYQSRIRSKVEADNKGKFVVIDIDSGDYEIDSEDILATKRLLVRRAQAVIYGLRVGYRAAYRLGRIKRAEVGVEQ